MYSYASTFISGFSEVIEDLVSQQSSKIQLTNTLDGLIFYNSVSKITPETQFPFFNNTFFLLNQTKITSATTTASIVKQLFTNVSVVKKVRNIYAGKTFRIIISRENQLTSINKEIIRKIEHKIGFVAGLKVDPVKADYELWVMIRSEGVAMLGLRLPHPHKEYAKGELRTELAYLLCALSNPQPKDVFLDPFAGHGSIPAARATHFPYAKIITSDKDKEMVQKTRKRLIGKSQTEARHMEAMHLTAIENDTITKIVTDVPWGFFSREGADYVLFYGKMLKEFLRVLKPDGTMVILTGRKEEFEHAISLLPNQLLLQRQYNILVSGKKAGAYVLTKR